MPEYDLGTARGRIELDASGVTKGTAEASAGVESLGNKSSESSKGLKKLETAGLVMGAVVVAAFGYAIKVTADFERKLSEMQAVSGATGDEMDAMRAKALQLGADTVFSAGEAAGAMVELAKAGLSVQDIMGGAADATVLLAAAGGIDLPEAAKIAAAALNQFKLSAADLPGVADLLAGAANASATGVKEVGLALSYVGPVANAAGLSIEDTAGAIALLANNGIDGEKAGTALRGIIASLNPTSRKATEAMKELGLITADGANQFFDASGKMKSMEEIIGVLNKAFGGLTEQQKIQAATTIFGREALAGILAMASQTSGEFADFQAVIGNVSAQEVADEKLNNLSGSLEQLRGSIETALIEGGSKATGALRGLVDTMTTMLNGFAAMPGPMQNAFLGATGLITLGLAAAAAYSKLSPIFDSVRTALTNMGGIAGTVGANLAAVNVVVLALVAGGLILSYVFGKNAADAAASAAETQKYADAMKAAGGSNAEFEKSLREIFSKNRVGEVLADTTADINIFTRAVRDSGTELDDWAEIARSGDPFGDLGRKLRDAADGGDELATEILRLADNGELTDAQIRSLVMGLDGMNDKVDSGARSVDIENQMMGGLATGAGTAAGASDQLAASQGDVATQAAASAAEMDKARNAVEKYFKSITDSLSTNIDFEAAIDDLTQSFKDNGLNLDISTEAGRKNMEQLISTKDAAIAHGLAVLAETGDTNLAIAAAEGHANALADTMRAAGLTDQQIRYLLTTMGLTPEQIETQFHTPGLVDAQNGVGDLNGKLDRTNRGASARVDVDTGSATWQLDEVLRKLIIIGNTSDDLYARGIGIRPRARGGPVKPYNAYRVHDTRDPELLSLADGTSLLLTGSQGGFVTNLAKAMSTNAGTDPNLMRAFMSMDRPTPNLMTAPSASGDKIDITLDFTGAILGAGAGEEIKKVLNSPDSYKELITSIRAGRR